MNPETRESHDEREARDYVADCIIDFPSLGERWLNAKAARDDNPRLVADEVATRINSGWGDGTITLEEAFEALRKASHDSIRKWMRGPPTDVQ